MNNKQILNVAPSKITKEEDRFFSVKTVSKMYDIKEDTIRKWIIKRFLPSYNVRGLVRVKLSDFESLMSRKPSKEEAAKKILRII